MRDDLQAFLARARGGNAATARVFTLDELSAQLAAPQPSVARFSFEALRGRFVELSALGASAVLTAAVGLVLEAQLAGEPTAWVTLECTSFYPPDVAQSGVDLAALVVVRAPELVKVVRAAEQLARSGAFGLIVLDLAVPERLRKECLGGAAQWGLPVAAQGRLVGLAQQHGSVVVCLTEKRRDHESLGSLVSLRAEAQRERRGAELVVSLRALKDKRNGPGWHEHRTVCPPDGMS